MDASSIIGLLSNYLPESVLGPLDQLLSLPSQLSSASPSSFIPILLSLVTLYFTIMSLWSTTRFFLRLAWVFTKWGTILGALGVVWSNWGNEELGTTRGSVESFGKVGRNVWSVGKMGAGWLASQQQQQSGKRGVGRGRTAASTSGRSASGKKKTWARPNDDGGWDDPPEVGLGGEGNVDDTLNWVKDRFLTFMSSPGSNNDGPSKLKKKGGASAKGKKAQKDPLGGLGGWAFDQAVKKAVQTFEDATEGSGSSAGKGKKKGFMNR